MNSTPTDDAFVSGLIGFQRNLYAYIYTLNPNLTDAEDILQETNAAILRKRSELTEDVEFTTWAIAVAYYQVLTHRKRKARDRRSVLLDDELLAVVAQQAAERTDRHQDRLRALSACLEKLPEADRGVVDLRCRGGLTSEVIAGRLSRT